MKNKNVKKWIFLVWILFLMINTKVGHAQDVSMHTQGIMQQEFLNPAYNSFRDYVSLSAYSRAQWSSEFEYAPETYVANLFVPMRKTKLGANLGVIVEDVGLRSTTELKFSLCHNIRLTDKSFLAFGYSVGFLQNTFDKDKVISYPDEDLSFLIGQADLNTIYPTASLGVLFLAKKWFVGVSSMTTSIKSDMDDSKYLPGFDFATGAMFELSPWLAMRPGLVVKYYNEKGYRTREGVIVKDYSIPVVYDLSANFLVANRMWLGTSHRFNQAQTFSLDLEVGQNLKLGYTFELGIGEGLHQFNSHGIRFSYAFGRKSDQRANDRIEIWPEIEEETDDEVEKLIY